MDEQRLERALREGPKFATRYVPRSFGLENEPAGRRTSGRQLVLLIAVTALLMAGMLAGLAALGVWRDAERAASNGWIAVSANPWDVSGGESGDIYLLSESDAPRRIIGSDGDHLAQACPQFSPDGTMLAYGEASAGGRATNSMRRFWLVPDRAVVVVGFDSGGAISAPIARATLPPEEGDMPCPSWSPDGRSIAFRDRHTLWVADAESGETTAFDVTSLREQERGPFAWSRDGSHIAIVESDAIRVLRVEDGTSSLIEVGAGRTPDSVSWAGGDTAIAYIPTDAATFAGGLAVHVVGVDGQNDRQLTPPDSPDAQMQREFYGAVVSPDGTRLAFVEHSYRCPEVFGPSASPIRCPTSLVLVTMDLDGSNSVEFPIPDAIFIPGTSLEDHFGLRWSPDGERLLLSSFAGVVSVSAASSAVIVHASGDELNLEWSASRVAWQPVVTDD